MSDDEETPMVVDAHPEGVDVDESARSTPGRSSEKRIRRVNPKFADSGDSLGFIDPSTSPRNGKRKRSADGGESTPKRRKVSASTEAAVDAKEIRRKKLELEKQMKEIDAQIEGLPDPAKKAAKGKKKAPKAPPKPKLPATPSGDRAKRARKKTPIATPPNNDLVRVMRKARKAVSDTLSHRFAWPFAVPVDAEGLGLWDYHQIIKEPMDLGTVLKNIDDNQYQSLDEVISDVELVWKNCMTYNLPESDIYIMCQRVKEVFDKHITKVQRDEARLAERAASRPAKRATPISGKTKQSKSLSTSTDHVSEIISLRESVQALQAQIERLQSEPVAPLKRDPDLIPMTKEEKQKLSKTIQRGGMGAEHLGVIVLMIQESMPDLPTAGEEIEIDLDALDTATLRKLERYVESACKMESKKKKKKKPRVGRQAASASAAPVQHSTTPATASKDEDVMVDVDDTASTATPAPSQPAATASVVVEKVEDEASSGSGSSDNDTDSDSSSDSDFDVPKPSNPPPVSGGTAVRPAATSIDSSADQVSFGLEADLAASSALVSSAEADTTTAVGEAEVDAVKEVELENADAWDVSQLEDEPEEKKPDDAAVADTGEEANENEPLWSAFKEKEHALREKKRERDERERLAREKQLEAEREQERRIAEQRQKEEEEAKAKEKEQEELQQRREREREERRKAARLQREQKASRTAINLTEQSQMMAEFEQGRM